MKVAIFARVSTTNNGQDPTMQTRELREYAERRGWTVADEYVDIGISGTKEKRPELDRLMADAHRRRFDAVVVWKFDRFARSVSHLLRALETFKAQGIEFVSFSEQLDTTTPAGKLVFTVLGAVAELERSLIVERVKAGLRNARAKGKKLGRPRVYPDVHRITALHAEGFSWGRSPCGWVLVKELCIARRRLPPETICGRSQQKGRPPYEGERKWQTCTWETFHLIRSFSWQSKSDNTRMSILPVRVPQDSPYMTWREYHELTKHSVESLRRTQHYLDWANMPNPFRHYESVPILDLPADPLPPKISGLEVLEGKTGNTSARDGAGFLSQLMFYSASISASKRVSSTGDTYALRVNPSSGNLHPTEFHFCTHGLVDWSDGLYHYRPSSHMAEQRAIGDFGWKLIDTSAPLVFVLTSIAWREAWKYRDRAYRYCLHDIGHAWQALTLAARSIGSESFALGYFLDDRVSESCLLSQDEWPMLIIGLHGPSIPVRRLDPVETILFGGQPNRLSEEQVPYPLIERIHAATKLNTEATTPSLGQPKSSGRSEITLPPSVSTSRSFGDVVRTRRSALDFRGGDESISLSQLATLLSSTKEPLFADFATARFVHLYLYVHRVEGLAPGVYRYWPEHAELEKIKEGDQRVVAAALSLGQDLAGNACLAFSMIGDFENAARSYGNRGYRYVHFEAGAIGQRMYLASEALGLRATGIGAFFDEEVNRYLSVAPELGQVVYHFAIGYPVPDPRLEA